MPRKPGGLASPGFLPPASLPRAASENLAQVVDYELDRFLPLPADKPLVWFSGAG